MPDAAPPGHTANVAEFTVSELSYSIKRTIEDGFDHVRVRGEISGYRGPHSSGHAYFALKDEGAKIEAVIWRGVFSRLRFKPEEGMEVIATGRVTTFPNGSKYQIVIEALEPAGVGALMALLEERRKKLGAEGLFDAARKKPLPYLPRVIGVVTSPTGAVIRDILHRLADRFPRHVLVWPVRVQGETSAAEVAAAIAGFNALPADGSAGIPRPDVLIVARGGGSLEDLWGFNEEIVVRAAAASRIPLVAAVGHETDWTLIDHAADLRAPTPTGAAEMVVPVRADLLETVATLGTRLDGAVRRSIDRRRTEWRSASRALPALRDLLSVPRQRLDLISSRLNQALVTATARHRDRFSRLSGRLSPATLNRFVAFGRQRLAALSGRLDMGARTGNQRARARLTPLMERGTPALLRTIETRRTRLEAAWRLLDTLSYTSVLKRGFALVRDDAGRPVRSATAVTPGMALGITFHDGSIGAIAGGEPPPARPDAPTAPAPVPPAPAPRTRPRKPAAPMPRQPSLFDGD